MSLTNILWQNAEYIYHAILQLPLIKEMMNGILPEEKFIFYMQQDALYLNDFAKALAIAGVRSSQSEYLEDFLHLALEGVAAEKEIHKTFFDRYGINPHVAKSPTCFAYTNYLIATACTATYCECIGALLPCYWIYREVGVYMSQSLQESNPYKEWIQAYCGEQFSRCVDKALSITEKIAEDTSKKDFDKMTHQFITATRMEWMFWDSMYRMEKWKPEAFQTT
jgi:thiaminase/transcriptional activator TenA